jgi:hypothetical protein
MVPGDLEARGNKIIDAYGKDFAGTLRNCLRLRYQWPVQQNPLRAKDGVPSSMSDVTTIDT